MFYPIQELRNGNINFLDSYLSKDYDKKNLINSIRNDNDKIILIKTFIYQIIDKYPSFCFDIIYDINEFNIETNYLLEKYNLYTSIDQNKLFNILNHTNYGVDLLLRHPEILDDNKLKIVFYYILTSKNKILINYFKSNRNLHTRYLFMDYLVLNDYKLFKEIYPNTLDYLTNIIPCYKKMSLFDEKITYKYMDIRDISSLAVHIKKYSEIDYLKIRNFILNNYEKNYLSEYLYNFDKEELEKNIDLYYETTNNYYLTLFKKYEKEISQNITHHLRYLINIYGIEAYINQKIFDSEILPLLYQWTTKYLDLSKSKEYKYLDNGSTAICYKIGDYVFKFIKFKWSYDDILCPNLYLILKNEEEKYIRNDKGIVTMGLEVQKYLSKTGSNIAPEILKMWEYELLKNGYILKDTLINGQCGTNAFLLNSYLDADTKDPESLPMWFKQTPLVLIDRDRVYRKDLPFKQIRNGY